VQIGQPLDRVGKNLLVQARVLGCEPVPKCFVVDCGKARGLPTPIDLPANGSRVASDADAASGVGEPLAWAMGNLLGLG